jgi:hypothetical protein
MAAASRTLIVAGDVVVDHYLYEGQRQRPTDGGQGMRVVRRVGGAAGLKALIEAVLPADAVGTMVDSNGEGLGNWEVKLGVVEPPTHEQPDGAHAFAVLRPQFRYPPDRTQFNTGKDAEKVWRIADLMGYGEHGGKLEPALPPPPTLPAADVLVLDDGGFVFRKNVNQGSWHLPSAGNPGMPRWILLKMSGPIASGDLWQKLISQFGNRLVCLMSIEDLRDEKLGLRPGLSWERTVEDISFALGGINKLTRCAHLIVTFSTDGALWIDSSKPDHPSATLIFDAASADGQFVAPIPGKMVGFQTTIAASVVAYLAHAVTSTHGTAPDLAEAIKRGLAAMRDLMDCGHGLVGKDAPDGYPIARLKDVLLHPTDQFATTKIPWPLSNVLKPDEIGRWMMVEVFLNLPSSPSGPEPVPLFGAACHVLRRGIKEALRHVPHARFGDLVTADRQEIETLRNIRRLMYQYKDNRSATKPLSIGVFGRPGAGKSFGVKQIAKEVFDKQIPNRSFEETAWLEFNLSQFTPPADLIGALHQVRDRVLSGVIPVVFWDEFDSREFEWLQYLLAPMQDGRFQEGQISHPVGRCVFIFAGGTSSSFAKFEERGGVNDQEQERFKSRKGPDFRSRIDAYYDVLGPNQRELPADGPGDSGQPDSSDLSYVLRRALMILSVLRTSGPLVDYDEGLVNALLRVPRYKNGARSLEKVVAPLYTTNNGPLRRSRLPAPAQLAMHVEPMHKFAELLALPRDSNWFRAMMPDYDWLEEPHA